jgi:hypothetical protein
MSLLGQGNSGWGGVDGRQLCRTAENEAVRGLRFWREARRMRDHDIKKGRPMAQEEQQESHQEPHQDAQQGLPAPLLDMHRAIRALIGQLESLDLNGQRFERCTDPELRRVLANQGDVARKQVAMLLEWMRRRDVKLDKEMKEALFKAGPIVAQFHYE